MGGFWSRLREGFRKATPTFHAAFGRLGQLLSGQTLTEADLEKLEEALYTADFGVETTAALLEEIRQAARRNPLLRGAEAAAVAVDVLGKLLQGAEGAFEPGRAQPEVICLLGVNGSGKTTTAGRLAHHFGAAGKSVLLGACDTFRAAAGEQIKLWASRVGVEIVASHHGADPAAVAFDAMQAAASRQKDLLVLDTAGRLHNRSGLMEELRKICRVLQKQDPSAPHHRWLVLDATTGTNALDQARAFHKEIGLTGLVFTRMDGTGRAGTLVSIYRELKLPIFFVGTGEKPEDLRPFSVNEYLEALFGSPEVVE